MTTALDGGERSASRPGRSLPPGKTRYPSYRRLDGPPGPVWTGAENLAAPVFDPWTIQTVAIPTELPGPRCTVVNRLNLNTSVTVRRNTAEDYCGCQTLSEIRWQIKKKDLVHLFVQSRG